MAYWAVGEDYWGEGELGRANEYYTRAYQLCDHANEREKLQIVASYYTNSITVFSIGSTGELTQNVPGSPFATDTGPYSIVANPSGSVLYTANDGMPTGTEATPGSISAFTIDSATTRELCILAVSDVNPADLDLLVASLVRAQSNS